MKRLIPWALALVAPAALYGQAPGGYAAKVSDYAVRLDGGNVVSGGGVTGGTCTNQVVTAIDTSGVPTCANVSSAMIPAATVTLADIANAASNRIVLGSGTAGSGAAYTEIGMGSNVNVSLNPAGVNKLGFDPRTQWFIYDDFLGVFATTTDFGSDTKWTVTASGSPGNLSKLAGSTATVGTDHPGVTVVPGSATNNGVFILRKDVSSLSLRGGEVVECMIWLTQAGANAGGATPWATPVGSFGCGFGDSTSAINTATDGALLYAATGDTHWQMRNRRAGGGNAVVSNTSITTDAWHRLTVWIETAGSAGVGTGSVHYYVDGTELSGSPVTSNVPEGDNQTTVVVGSVQSTGTVGAVALMYLDYVMAYGPLSR